MQSSQGRHLTCCSVLCKHMHAICTLPPHTHTNTMTPTDPEMIPGGSQLYVSEWEKHKRKPIFTPELLSVLDNLEMRTLQLISCWFPLYINVTVWLLI